MIAAEPLASFIPEEPVRSNIRWSPVASTGRHVRLTSLMRPITLDFDRALTLPFADNRGRFVVVMGSATEVTGAESHAEIRHFAREVGAIRARIHETRHREIDHAYRIVARAATSDISLERIFDITLAAARNLVDGDVAYLSLPVDDDHFAFVRTLGINTNRFRHLRVGPGEGLGGMARETGSPARTLNHEEYCKFHAAMSEETYEEGINSALAVPVHDNDNDNLEAILYVASRRMRAYSDADEQVLVAFANAALLGLDRSNLDESRREAVRDQERARLAQTLHDDLVRRLTQIGFAAEEIGTSLTGKNKSAAATISASVSECMSIVRDELHNLLQSDQTGGSTLGEVAEKIFSVPSLSGMKRSVDYLPHMGREYVNIRISEDIADAMCKVGQEAVFNAETHSGGNSCKLTFGIRNGMCEMTVTDNGNSHDTAISPKGHYGIEFIRREVRRVGGEVQFTNSYLGGLEVRSRFPYT
ncbi:GAF domain-containing protein [Rhodococcus sp. 27YEA15]|uniref:GAF domain-containing sensor histidine kinase n=1 Tax=Rhodococcus sp. 27YEA15 TaxID=3156259 RepID=UPI003C7D0EB5